MIYTPENSPGSITVDVEKGEYIYDVLAVDMDNATVEVIDRPLRIRPGSDEIVTRKLQFLGIKMMPGLHERAKMFLCERAVMSWLNEAYPCFSKLPDSEIQPDTKE